MSVQEALFGTVPSAQGSHTDAPLIGIIDESRHIYDTKMPHFSYQVDKLMASAASSATTNSAGKVSKRVLVMVRDVESSRSSSRSALPTISLTLLNSRLQGSKQISLSLEETEFSLLGPLNSGNTPIQPLNMIQNELF